MDARLEQLTHREVWQCHWKTLLFRFWPDARDIALSGHRTEKRQLASRPPCACGMAGVIGTRLDGCKRLGSKRPMTANFRPGSPVPPRDPRPPAQWIGAVALLGLGDQDLIPLWFGETTRHPRLHPGRGQEGARRRPDLLHQCAGHPPLARGASANSTGVRSAPRSDSIGSPCPGAAMLAVVTGAPIGRRDRRQHRRGVAGVAQYFPGREHLRRRGRFARLDEDWNASAPRWTLDLEKLFAACDARTRAIFIASPGNPTGWI